MMTKARQNLDCGMSAGMYQTRICPGWDTVPGQAPLTHLASPRCCPEDGSGATSPARRRFPVPSQCYHLQRAISSPPKITDLSGTDTQSPALVGLQATVKTGLAQRPGCKPSARGQVLTPSRQSRQSGAGPAPAWGKAAGLSVSLSQSGEHPAHKAGARCWSSEGLWLSCGV